MARKALPVLAPCPLHFTPMQVGELAAVVAKIKAEYDEHEARLKERLDRLKVRAGIAQAGRAGNSSSDSSRWQWRSVCW